MGMGEHVCGDPPPGELAGQPAAAPAHPGVDHHVAEQVDVEGAAGPAAGQGKAGGQLVQRLGVLDE
jgi:hypothetical protein